MTRRKQPELEPLRGDAEEDCTLWEATIFIPGGDEQTFYFRASEDFSLAATTANELVKDSPGCRLVGASIVEVKRIALLWN
jgi:hypothetical protein